MSVIEEMHVGDVWTLNPNSALYHGQQKATIFLAERVSVNKVTNCTILEILTGHGGRYLVKVLIDDLGVYLVWWDCLEKLVNRP